MYQIQINTYFLVVHTILNIGLLSNSLRSNK